LALSVTGRSYPGYLVVWPAEIGVGIALAAFFLVTGVMYRRRVEAGLGKPAAI
jgi:hypothetical protein